MQYKIVSTAAFEKSLSKLNQDIAKRVIKWIIDNLENTTNPKSKGKQLRYNLKNYWRYRIGDYRLLVEIVENELVLRLITVAHRSKVYKSK
jgi:mRNA interferase RelE/StbE